MQIHVVQRVESLWGIAQRYSADMNQIVLVNQLDNPDVLVVGQALVIPDPNREYVVQAGDNLWSIAQIYGVPVQELAEFNNITNPSLIYIGQMLIIPYFPHIVQPGESLWAIAQGYGVSVNQIIQANNITNLDLIHIGQTLGIPAADRPVTETNAFTTQLNEQGRQEVLMLGRNFTYLSPFSYNINSDGTITELQDQLVLEAADATNTAPLLVLTNFTNGGFDSDLAAAILRNPDLQETLITNLINEMRVKGYAGINFDLEYIYPEDRENYNDFLRLTVARMHPQGFIVSTAVAPKVSADQQGLLYEAHDYQAHGEIVDFVVVMTYEWGWAGGRPWAIAPINEVRQVLDYAVSVIPRNKISIGIPLYGRDWEIPWVEGTTAQTISPKEAVQLAAQYGAAIEYDETYQSPFFRYVDENGQAHEVWFEDAGSVQAKYDTLKNYGLRGVSYWVLGNPFPQNWAVLQRNFRIRKF
ncbi:LysM peptidoglycan-binding domain-containing protein [Virgibacillus sp. NKC19-16]|uniref:LysM peptidoglycan-binding domain-containing protein n=1 Tax=Virgibacillus salidurans TaxID=2831673 RepID=UPI001F394C63|nr:LysM peptidoglycan-binding domain-containing protein [Virgibacillus sp. NKC19-16]UJL46760.1 LysM peptidoglycan-binding domain-containing protein [Virgibacillus sp. NKC19-16]